jgi:hypothetical protein
MYSSECAVYTDVFTVHQYILQIHHLKMIASLMSHLHVKIDHYKNPQVVSNKAMVIPQSFAMLLQRLPVQHVLLLTWLGMASLCRIVPVQSSKIQAIS